MVAVILSLAISSYFIYFHCFASPRLLFLFEMRPGRRKERRKYTSAVSSILSLAASPSFCFFLLHTLLYSVQVRAVVRADQEAFPWMVGSGIWASLDVSPSLCWGVKRRRMSWVQILKDPSCSGDLQRLYPRVVEEKVLFSIRNIFFRWIFFNDWYRFAIPRVLPL